jgi:hypothetical protein
VIASGQLMAIPSHRRLPNLMNSQALEAVTPIRTKRGDFHHGPEHPTIHIKAEYATATGSAVTPSKQPGARGCVHMPTPRARSCGHSRRCWPIHDRVEEGPNGVYAKCDHIADTETEALTERLRTAPDVPAIGQRARQQRVGIAHPWRIIRLPLPPNLRPCAIWPALRSTLAIILDLTGYPFSTRFPRRPAPPLPELPHSILSVVCLGLLSSVHLCHTVMPPFPPTPYPYQFRDRARLVTTRSTSRDR